MTDRTLADLAGDYSRDCHDDRETGEPGGFKMSRR